MGPALLHTLALATRILGVVIVVLLGAISIDLFRQARRGSYYVVREQARARALRLAGLSILGIVITFGLSFYIDYLAGRFVSVARVTATPTPTSLPLRPTITPSPEAPTGTASPRPTTTPLPVPTASPTPTRIPPTDLPPTLLTPLPSAVPAVPNASFGPIQFGSAFVSFQLAGISSIFPRDTPIIHATFLVRNMNRDAAWTAAWYKDGKYVAGDPLLWNFLPNTVGHVYYGQPGGFKPGQWELRLYIEDRLQSKGTFTILNATSTPTITPTPLPTATETPPVP